LCCPWYRPTSKAFRFCSHHLKDLFYFIKHFLLC
jgi:hypothetical protein